MHTVGFWFASSFVSVSCLGQTLPAEVPVPFVQGGKLPGHVKLTDGFLSPSKPAPAIKMRPKAPATAGKCAHIIAKMVKPDIDPKIILKEQALGNVDRMPMIKGLPVCSEDVR